MQYLGVRGFPQQCLVALVGKPSDDCFLTGNGIARLRVTFGALGCFAVADLRRRDLTRLSPALERRLMALPEAQEAIVAG